VEQAGLKESGKKKWTCRRKTIGIQVKFDGKMGRTSDEGGIKKDGAQKEKIRVKSLKRHRAGEEEAKLSMEEETLQKEEPQITGFGGVIRFSLVSRPVGAQEVEGKPTSGSGRLKVSYS